MLGKQSGAEAEAGCREPKAQSPTPTRARPHVTSDPQIRKLRSPQVGGGSLASLVFSHRCGSFLSSFRSCGLGARSSLILRLHGAGADRQARCRVLAVGRTTEVRQRCRIRQAFDPRSSPRRRLRGTELYTAKRGEAIPTIARHYLGKTSYLTSSELADAIREREPQVRRQQHPQSERKHRYPRHPLRAHYREDDRRC